METTTYQRKPFRIEAVEITNENIEEIGAKIGRVMTRAEDGVKFIQIDSVIIPGIARAYVGFWLTIMDNRYRCYSGRIFNAQFEKVPEDPSWIADQETIRNPDQASFDI